MSKDLNEAVKYVIDNNGKNVLLDYNRFIKAFYKSIDAPDMIKDRHPVDIAMEKGIGELFINSRPEDIKKIRAEIKSRLNGILSEKVIDMIIDAFVSALGWEDKIELIRLKNEIDLLKQDISEIKRHLVEFDIEDGVLKKYNGNDVHLGIPESVISIGENAFYNCRNIEFIVISSSVTSISESAFSYCTSLWFVNICNSVTSIGDKAFFNCTSLRILTIPDSVTSIGDEAFSNCTSLRILTIPDSVTSIGDKAFSDCTSLEIVTISNSVTSISNNAFSSCTSLKSVTIPDSVTEIGYGAFRGCTSLESVIIPDSVTSIFTGAFYQCTSLKSVTIPDSVTSISNSAFEGCENLEISIPKGCKYDKNAFSGCKKVIIRK